MATKPAAVAATAATSRGTLIGVRLHKQTCVGGEWGNRTGDVFCLACQSVCLEEFFEEAHNPARAWLWWRFFVQLENKLKHTAIYRKKWANEREWTMVSEKMNVADFFVWKSFVPIRSKIGAVSNRFSEPCMSAFHQLFLFVSRCAPMQSSSIRCIMHYIMPPTGGGIL